MQACTASTIEKNTGAEKKVLCSVEMFYNNCPSVKASHSACEWKEVFPQCENRVDFAAKVTKVRGYSTGKASAKRVSGMIVELDDGTTRTFGEPKGRYTVWDSKNQRIRGMEFVHQNKPLGISFL